MASIPPSPSNMLLHLGHVHHYLVRPATTLVKRIAAEDNKCPTYWRPFNTIEDVLDPTEQPCRAFRLRACSHIIGSHCLKQYMARNMLDCPLCRARIVQVPIVPRWITYLLAGSEWLVSAQWTRSMSPMICKDPQVVVIHIRVLAAMVAGTLTFIDSYMLWLLYMIIPIAQTIFGIVFVLCAHMLASYLRGPLANMLPGPFRGRDYTFEVVGVDLGLVAALLNITVLSMFGILPRCPRPTLADLSSYVFSLVVSGQKLKSVGGIWALLGIMMAPMFLYGVVVGWVLLLGRRGWKQRGW